MNNTLEKARFHVDLERLLADEEPCDRLYFGHEFCQRRLPQPEAVRRAVQRTRERSLGFTLVTPFVTDAGLSRVRELLAVLADEKRDGELELVVNDWGVLRCARRELNGVKLVLGRLLTKQKRGPRLLRLLNKIPAKALDHFRRSNVDVANYVGFLKSQGVERVELDNLLHGIKRSADVLTASLYVPYGYISTTRLCLIACGDRADKNLRSLGPCHAECRQYDVRLTHEDMPVPIKLKGNTQFFENGRLPEDPAALSISRLVEQPRIPV